MNDEQLMVDEFHEKMGLQRPWNRLLERPCYNLEDLNGELRCKLIEEEAREYREAWEKRDPVAMIDALCDTIYVAYGAAVAMGVDLEEYFYEVHDSNMAKLGPDGKPTYREDGKLLKPETWKPPDLESIFKRHTRG